MIYNWCICWCEIFSGTFVVNILFRGVKFLIDILLNISSYYLEEIQVYIDLGRFENIYALHRV